MYVSSGSGRGDGRCARTGWSGDVGSGQKRVYRWTRGEEDGEDALHARRGLGLSGEPCRIEVLDERTSLELVVKVRN